MDWPHVPGVVRIEDRLEDGVSRATRRRESRQAIHVDAAGRWHLEEAFGDGPGTHQDRDIGRRVITEAEARAWCDQQGLPWPPTSASTA